MLPHRAAAPPGANHPKPHPHAQNHHNQLQFSFSHSSPHLRRLSLSPAPTVAIRLRVNYCDSRAFLTSRIISEKDQSKGAPVTSIRRLTRSTSGLMSSGKICALITSFALYKHARTASDPGERLEMARRSSRSPCAKSYGANLM